jgi:zinc transport system permease protein
MMEFLSYGFLQRALFAGVFVAVACALLGVFLILRRDSMIGHGLAHVTFAGVAIGLMLQIVPLLTALILAVFTGLLIMKIKEKAGLYGDTAIAIFSSTGFAVGILLVSLSQDFSVDLFAYLFGDILAIETFEVWLSVALALAVVFVVLRYYHPFMFLTFDRESAMASGVKVKRLDIILTILTAITVVLGMKVVGILLVAALLVIPAAAGLQLAASFKLAMVISAAVALFSVVGGLFLSFYGDFPASATIVLLAFCVFSLFYFLKGRKRG